MNDTTVLLRFADLQARGIVRNRQQLHNLTRDLGFPRGWLLSPNARVWDEPDIAKWLEGRRKASAESEAA